MVVTAINGVQQSNNIAFTGKKTNKGGQLPANNPSISRNDLAKVPVVIMMMSPSMLNGEVPVQQLNTEKVVRIMDQVAQADELEPSTYIMETTPQNGVNQVSSFVKPEYVQYKKRFVSGGKAYTMYFVDDDKPTSSRKNFVSFIFFVPDGYKPVKINGEADGNMPPMYDALVLHDVKGEEFMGVRVHERLHKFTPEDRFSSEKTKYARYEIRLPGDVANDIIDLAAGDFVTPKGVKLQCTNHFGAHFETVKTPNLDKREEDLYWY